MLYASRLVGAENFLKDRRCRDERKQWGSQEKMVKNLPKEVHGKQNKAEKERLERTQTRNGRGKSVSRA